MTIRVAVLASLAVILMSAVTAIITAVLTVERANAAVSDTYDPMRFDTVTIPEDPHVITVQTGVHGNPAAAIRRFHEIIAEQGRACAGISPTMQTCE